MNKISKNDYKNFISWAKENTANTVYPCSIAEGFQSGDIYVNDGKVCAVAFSAAVSLDEIDIGVETHEDYRRNNYGSGNYLLINFFFSFINFCDYRNSPGSCKRASKYKYGRKTS